MSNQIGTLHFLGTAGSPLDFHVFEDAIVLIEAGRGHRAGLAFGAIGGAVSATSANRQVKKRREQAEAAGFASASELAAAVDGAQLLLIGDVESARLDKALGKGRKLTVRTREGGSRTYRFASNRQPPEEVVAVLGAALGDRFESTLG